MMRYNLISILKLNDNLPILSAIEPPHKKSGKSIENTLLENCTKLITNMWIYNNRYLYKKLFK